MSKIYEEKISKLLKVVLMKKNILIIFSDFGKNVLANDHVVRRRFNKNII